MQIPSMSKDYITKLLFDGKHESLVVRDKKGEVAGGACYRYFPDNKFI
jgi:histone acetyltransferase